MRLIVCSALLLGLAGCRATPPPDIPGTVAAAVRATVAAQPLATSRPPLPVPTTPRPAARAATAAPTAVPSPSNSACIGWQQARDAVGQTACVTGMVTNVSNRPTSHFIDFSPDRTSFYVFSPSQTFDTSLKGKCIEVRGKIELFRDRPQIVVNDPGQVRQCAS
jgi:hypothetical protein